MELISGSHSVGQNLYHLEWCPKYRYKMFIKEENKKLCEEILKEVAERHKMKIEELSVMLDHIHVVVGIPPTMSVSQALHLLKSAKLRYGQLGDLPRSNLISERLANLEPEEGK